MLNILVLTYRPVAPSSGNFTIPVYLLRHLTAANGLKQCRIGIKHSLDAFKLESRIFLTKSSLAISLLPFLVTEQLHHDQVRAPYELSPYLNAFPDCDTAHPDTKYDSGAQHQRWQELHHW